MCSCHVFQHRIEFNIHDSTAPADLVSVRGYQTRVQFAGGVIFSSATMATHRLARGGWGGLPSLPTNGYLELFPPCNAEVRNEWSYFSAAHRPTSS
jgi:hypothetical protein